MPAPLKRRPASPVLRAALFFGRRFFSGRRPQHSAEGACPEWSRKGRSEAGPAGPGRASAPALALAVEEMECLGGMGGYPAGYLIQLEAFAATQGFGVSRGARRPDVKTAPLSA